MKKHVKNPPKPFRLTNASVAIELMRRFPLATIQPATHDQEFGTLIPLLVNEESDSRIQLRGHVDKNNPLTKHIAHAREFNVFFRSNDAYASPDIYPDEQLPGWLYVSVGARARVTRTLFGNAVAKCLIESTNAFGSTDQNFRLDPKDPRIDMFSPGILAFELSILRFFGIAKLAQDKGAYHSELACKFLGGRDSDLADFYWRTAKSTMDLGWEGRIPINMQ